MRKSPTSFTDEEVAILKEHYETMRNQDIVDQFMPHKTTNQIKSKAHNLGLKKDKEMLKKMQTETILKVNSDKAFTEYELDIIREYYPEGGSKIVRKYIDRSADVIYNKAKEMGIKVYSTHPDLWRIDRIAQSKDNPYSVTVVYKKDGV